MGLVLFARQSFRPEAVYSTVSSAILAWFVHTMALKTVLWVLGIASAAPVLELASYAGYTFLLSCIILVGQLAFGEKCPFLRVVIYLFIYLLQPISLVLLHCRENWLPRRVGLHWFSNVGLYSSNDETRDFPRSISLQ